VLADVECIDLHRFRDAAVDAGRRQGRGLGGGKGVEGAVDLHGELAGGRDDEDIDGAGLGCLLALLRRRRELEDVTEGRNAKRQRLAAARLCDGDGVPAGEEDGPGGGLNGRGLVEASEGRFERVEDGEVVEADDGREGLVSVGGLIGDGVVGQIGAGISLSLLLGSFFTLTSGLGGFIGERGRASEKGTLGFFASTLLRSSGLASSFGGGVVAHRRRQLCAAVLPLVCAQVSNVLERFIIPLSPR
jgi:hypothetical protein